MTKIKLCGISRLCDVECVNQLKPEYTGFVFYPKSRRNLTLDQALMLKQNLNKDIKTVGVFVDYGIDKILELVDKKIIDLIQLHGHEDNDYINRLREKTNCPIIQAFLIKSEDDIKKANNSIAEYILLDSGLGSGKMFNHSLIKNITRDYFLAGGLTSDTVADAISEFNPYAVDVSSAIETNGLKDKDKMIAFVNAVRNRKDENK